MGLLVFVNNHVFQLLFYFQEYNANEDDRNVVVNTLDEPILARYVRIHPTDWHGQISMRMELYGCYSGKMTKDLADFKLLPNFS